MPAPEFRFRFLPRPGLVAFMSHESRSSVRLYIDCLCAMHDLIEHARALQGNDFHARFVDSGVARAILDRCIKAVDDQPDWLQDNVKTNVGSTLALVRAHEASERTPEWSGVLQRETSLAAFTNDAVRQYTLVRLTQVDEAGRAV